MSVNGIDVKGNNGEAKNMKCAGDVSDGRKGDKKRDLPTVTLSVVIVDKETRRSKLEINFEKFLARQGKMLAFKSSRRDSILMLLGGTARRKASLCERGQSLWTQCPRRL